MFTTETETPWIQLVVICQLKQQAKIVPSRELSLPEKNLGIHRMKDTIKILADITKRDVEKCLVGVWFLMNHIK